MRYLTIIRHAKSSWDNTLLSDFERPLNKRGYRNAPVMGERISKEHLRPDLVVSSPAIRALETAEIICDKIGYQSPIATHAAIYEAGVGDLQSVIEAITDEAQHLMLFGHNPGLESLCAFIEGGAGPALTTCNCVHYKLAIDVWRAFDYGCGKRVFHWTPKDTL